MLGSTPKTHVNSNFLTAQAAPQQPYHRAVFLVLFVAVEGLLALARRDVPLMRLLSVARAGNV